MKPIKKPPLYLLLLLVCIGSVGAVLYTPALPTIASFFGVSFKKAALSMTIYLVGYALGQLPYGPLSNQIGRKKTLLIGLGIAASGATLSLLAAYFHSFSLFLFSRLLFSLGATSGLQVVYTMVGDLYAPPKSIKIASYLTLTFAIGPSISTTIGGFLTDYFGWQSCFVFLALYSLILLTLSTQLEETALFDTKDHLKLGKMISLYKKYFWEKKILFTALIIGLAISFNYSFATLAPSIVISEMGFAPHLYGLMNTFPSASLVLGALLASFLASQASYNPMKGVYAAILATFGLLFLMLICFFLAPQNIFFFIIPYALVLFTQPIIETNVLCLALYHHQNKSLTSSVINSISIFLCAFFSLSSKLFTKPKAIHLVGLFLFLTFLMSLSFGILNKKMVNED